MGETTRQREIRQRILEEIYVYGPVSRIDIARRTGITPATVTTVTAALLMGGAVREAGEANATTGRPKVLLQMTGGGRYYVGCELRAEAYTFALIDARGTVCDRHTIAFDAPFDPAQATIATLITGLQAFCARHADKRLCAIGIALPGHYVPEAEHIASDHPHWSQFDFKAVNAAFTLPIYYENNAHAMAMTERLFNSHQKDETFIFFHVARGVFCSTIYQGRSYGHANPLVGEVAHMVVNAEGELCTCGRRGCLQTYAAENWIMQKARVLYAKAAHTYLRQLAPTAGELTFDQVLQAYDLGDEGVMGILTNAIKYLAVAVTNFTLLIDAQRIVLHGKIFDRPALFAQLQQYLQRNQVMFTAVTPKRLVVKPVTLFDGAIGAAGMAICRDRLGFA